MKVLLVALVVCGFIVLGVDLLAALLGWKKYSPDPINVRIKSGQHAGREGRLVSIPWMGNGYNTSISVNVPATEQEIRDSIQVKNGYNLDRLLEDRRLGQGLRSWVSAWSWEVEPIE